MPLDVSLAHEVLRFIVGIVLVGGALFGLFLVGTALFGRDQ